VSAESARRYRRADPACAEGLVRRAAPAIENAQLCTKLREAHRRKDECLALLVYELCLTLPFPVGPG
jgi:hypothetical protein